MILSNHIQKQSGTQAEAINEGILFPNADDKILDIAMVKELLLSFWTKFGGYLFAKVTQLFQQLVILAVLMEVSGRGIDPSHPQVF